MLASRKKKSSAALTPPSPPFLFSLLQVLEGHTSGVRGVAWSPDGATLASGSDDGTLRVWDAALGSVLRVRISTPPAPAPQREGSGPGASGRASRRPGEKRALARPTRGRAWALSRPLAQAGGPFSPGNHFKALPDLPPLSLPLQVLEGHTGAVRAVAWSPDGATLASGGPDDKTVRTWAAASGALLRTILAQVPGHTGEVVDVAWAPDGATLASSANDESVQVWDAASGALLRVRAALTCRGPERSLCPSFGGDLKLSPSMR